MKRVFIYGDSNVWGDNFAGPRVPYSLRWTNRLKKLFVSDYEIIVDGVCGRVTGNYRSNKPECNGQSAFIEAYNKAGVIDIIIIALGTNDLQEKFNRSAMDVINDLMWYSSTTKGVEFIYILPPNFNCTEESGPEFTIKSLNVRSQIIENKDKFANYIVVDNVQLSDGVHFSVQGHKQMAKIIAEKLKTKA